MDINDAGSQESLHGLSMYQGIRSKMRSFHLSLSQPLPQPVEPQPNGFFFPIMS